LREQTVVHTRVLVLLELGELVLANVHHCCKASCGRDVDSAVLFSVCEGREMLVVRQQWQGVALARDRDDVGHKAWNELSPVTSLPLSGHSTGVYRWRKAGLK
jgi:hypothetical protein